MAPITYIEIKNIISPGWVGFAQLQRKLLQDLDDTLFDTIILLPKQKQNCFYMPLFVGGSLTKMVRDLLPLTRLCLIGKRPKTTFESTMI